MHFLDLVGIEYGPVIVTAVDLGDGPKVRCPFCLEHLPLQEGWLGQEISCPEQGCDARMRVNPFVVSQPARMAPAAPEPRIEPAGTAPAAPEPPPVERPTRERPTRKRTPPRKRLAPKKAPWWAFWRRG